MQKKTVLVHAQSIYDLFAWICILGASFNNSLLKSLLQRDYNILGKFRHNLGAPKPNIYIQTSFWRSCPACPLVFMLTFWILH